MFLFRNRDAGLAIDQQPLADTKPARALAIASQSILLSRLVVTEPSPPPKISVNVWFPLMPVHIHSPSTPNTNTPACALTPPVAPASHPLTSYFPAPGGAGGSRSRSAHCLWPKP